MACILEVEQRPVTASGNALPARRPHAQTLLTSSVLSLFDQGLVSGTRFLTTILVARFCGVEELGKYSLAMTAFMMAFAVQQSLVFGPFTVFHNRGDASRPQGYSGNAFLLFLCLNLLLVVVILSAGAGVCLVSDDDSVGITLLILGICLPFLFLREYARQRQYADLNMPQVLLVDTVTLVVQFAGLLALVVGGSIDSRTAILAAAIAAGVGGIIVIGRNRRQLQSHLPALRSDARRHWRFGRWSLAGQMTDLFTWQSLTWIVLFQLGLSETGLFAACLSIIALSNPVILALGNVLAPRATLVCVRDGHKQLERMIARTTWAMVAVIGLFCLVILLFGSHLLNLVYGSLDYQAAAVPLFVLSLSVLCEVIGDTAHHAMLALDRPDISFRSSLMGLCVTLTMAWPATGYGGLTGAAVSILLGTATTTLLRWQAYRCLLRAMPKGLEA